MKTQDSQVQRLNELIQGIDSVMFTTIHSDGSVHSRPMIVQDFEFDGSLWFFTQRSSSKVDAIAEDSHINIAFMDPSSNRYISMAGHAHVVDDNLLMKKMWSERFGEWFAGGVSDPDLVLLQVAISHAEYWDTPHAEVVETFCLTGEPMKLNSIKTTSQPTQHYFHS